MRKPMMWAELKEASCLEEPEDWGAGVKGHF